MSRNMAFNNYHTRYMVKTETTKENNFCFFSFKSNSLKGKGRHGGSKREKRRDAGCGVYIKWVVYVLRVCKV